MATTGTFTIPLMKKVGLPPYKAGAVEVGASTNGQLMPPVMGAAAFIMAEFLGLAYLDVVRAAILPALLSYIALFYVVHLEALKLNLRPLREDELPSFWHTLISGIHYVVPILALIYTLVILRMSAVASAFNAILLTMAIIVVQRPMQNTIAVLGDMKREKGVAHLRELFGEAHFKELEERLWNGVLSGFGESFGDVWQGLMAGAKNMMGIGVATAAAGIIVGTVTLTGLSGRFIELIEIVSLGNVVLMLVLTAICSLILGMGLPTTANYIVMATLTAPVIVSLGGKAGLVVPAARGPSVRLLFRHPGRRHAARGSRRVRRLGDSQVGPHPDGRAGLRLRLADRRFALRLHLQPGTLDDAGRRPQGRDHLDHGFHEDRLGLRGLPGGDVRLRLRASGLFRR